MATPGLNRWTGFGALGSDPDLKKFRETGTMLKWRMACNERFKTRDGRWEDRVEWVNCVMWGARAEKLAPLLGKGSKVYVEGALRTSSYEKDGHKRYSTEVHVSHINLASPPKDTSGRRGGGWDDDESSGDSGSSGGGDEGRDEAGKGEDDIPFIWNVTAEPEERWTKKRVASAAR